VSDRTSSRILTAIQRFERTRKLSPERRDIFYKYLAYGGIDVGPNMFQGGIDPDSLDKDQLAAAMARTSIAADKRDLDGVTQLYEVDFEGCVKSFLSRRAMVLFGLETRPQVEEITTTIERFMDYLLQHDVCPECRADVLKTRNFCREALPELWGCAEASRWLPGDFNIACSTLFGGNYGRDYDGETDWGPERPGEYVFVGMKPEQAMEVVHYAVAGAASEEVYKSYLEITKGHVEFKILSVNESAGFEITKIEYPSPECLDIYRESRQTLRPVGRVHAKPWTNPDAQPQDLTPQERDTLVTAKGSRQAAKEEYIFFIESVVQKHLRVGMKLEATIHKLNCGIWFFDEFLRIYPSFDIWLCNELMIGWKEPRPTKGAPDDVEEG